MSDDDRTKQYAAEARENARRGLAGLGRVVGRRYPALERLVETITDPEAGRDFMRLARDMEAEVAKERRRVREPWRR